jgi:primosomal protein N' (replication factor Y) (superfamily II helicase)
VGTSARKAPAHAKRPRRAQEPAAELPVARVCVDVSLPHLDRPFDYLVPAESADAVRPGVRVRVRFAGQLVDGFVLERVERSEHEGRLAFLDRVVSAERVLTPDVARLCREVADRYAGTLPDVLRLAVPPRHARVEAASAAPPDDPGASGSAVGVGGVGAASAALSDDPGASASAVGVGGGGAASAALSDDPGASASAAGVGGAGAASAAPVIDDQGWKHYGAGAALLRAITAGRMPRAVWTALPGEDWPARLAEAAAASLAGGRGALIVVADARDLDRLDAALTTALGGSGQHVALSAAVGPAERYRRFLAASRGTARVVVGTRAAMFAPVADLGLVAIWDDGDDLHSEPRAPYPHARQVLLARAELAGCGALLGGFARSAEAQQLIEAGWAREVVADRDVLRRHAPRVVPVAEDGQLARDAAAAAARLPSVAWEAARDALQQGSPVLIQVPRRGYLPAVACNDCRTPARCAACSGPLALRSSTAPPACRWCGRPAADYACANCGGRRLRAAVIGARRTAEELARAFPGTPVRTSGRDGVLAEIGAEPALVVTTPGAEPVARGGYGAVLLLDTWALLTRADLRAAEEALRRWLAAAALCGARGRVVVVADGALAAVQALLRFDPGWLAARELADRRELGFPPAARVAALTGAPAAVAELIAAAELPEGAELLGPVPAGDDQERILVRTSRANGRALAAALRAAAGVRSAKKAPDPVRIQIDPLEVL